MAAVWESQGQVVEMWRFCPARRFVGGKLNMCYNAVDRHVDGGRGEQPAIIYDSPVGGAKEVITYRELQDQVRAVGGSETSPQSGEPEDSNWSFDLFTSTFDVYVDCEQSPTL